MKRTGFILAVFIVIIMQFCVCASAAGSPKISVKEVNCAPGELVEVDVVLENNSGISGASIGFAYDERLDLIEAKNGDAFSGLEFTAPGKLENSCRFLWDSVGETADKDGKVITLVFKVSGKAKVGESLYVNMLHSPDDVYDFNLENVNVDYVNGHVSISEEGNAGTNAVNSIWAFFVKLFAAIKTFFINIFGR